jgi:insecticidal toxin complex protein TccC
MKLIMNHVRAHSEFPIRAGVAGLHADVQTINDIANKLPLDDKGKFDSIGFRNALSDTVVFVHKLTKPGLNQAFPACGNCTGIIPDTVTVATGILPLGRHAEGSRRRLISG